MKEIFDGFVSIGWRDIADFAGMLIIVSAIALLAVGFAPC